MKTLLLFILLIIAGHLVQAQRFELGFSTGNVLEGGDTDPLVEASRFVLKCGSVPLPEN